MASYSWDSKIENPPEGGGDFVLLPEGVYPYSVLAFERGDHPGSAKLQPCPKATVTFEVGSLANGTNTIRDNFFLDDATIWKVSSFFKSCGIRADGETLDVTKFPTVVGRGGFCRLVVEDFVSRDGRQCQSNKIKTFLSPKEGEQRFTAQGSDPIPAPKAAPVKPVAASAAPAWDNDDIPF